MVYVTNEYLPGVRKIGVTNDQKGFKKRMSFGQSFIPNDIKLYKGLRLKNLETNMYVPDHIIENMMHKVFDEFRIKGCSANELFNCNEHIIDTCISNIGNAFKNKYAIEIIN